VPVAPAEEREVMGLVFYHSWTQAQVTERTVRNWWRSAVRLLTAALGGDLPDL
jgi:hypothetical protein